MRAGNTPSALFRLIRFGALIVEGIMGKEADSIEFLLERYANVPMDLADACLVRLCELHPSSSILTLDSDFSIYRKNRTESIPIILPD
ncbi:MAG: hypothetical protein SH809_00200 [Rhodothermales bacterium]|nr:hypothetical protein [Rhodothermales bacterium]